MEKVKNAFRIIADNPLPILGITLAFSFLEISIFKMISPYMSKGSISGIFSGGALALALTLAVYWLIRIVFLSGFIPMILSSVSIKHNIPVEGRVTLRLFKQSLTRERLFSILMLEMVVIPVLMVGILLLVVPGVFWFVITTFAYFIIFSNDTSAFDAVSKSVELSKGFRLKILGYLVIYSLLSLFLSMTPIFVSVLAETFMKAMLFVIFALIYRDSLEKDA